MCWNFLSKHCFMFHFRSLITTPSVSHFHRIYMNYLVRRLNNSIRLFFLRFGFLVFVINCFFKSFLSIFYSFFILFLFFFLQLLFSFYFHNVFLQFCFCLIYVHIINERIVCFYLNSHKTWFPSFTFHISHNFVI